MCQGFFLSYTEVIFLLRRDVRRRRNKVGKRSIQEEEREERIMERWEGVWTTVRVEGAVGGTHVTVRARPTRE